MDPPIYLGILIVSWVFVVWFQIYVE